MAYTKEEREFLVAQGIAPIEKEIAPTEEEDMSFMEFIASISGITDVTAGSKPTELKLIEMMEAMYHGCTESIEKIRESRDPAEVAFQCGFMDGLQSVMMNLVDDFFPDVVDKQTKMLHLLAEKPYHIKVEAGEIECIVSSYLPPDVKEIANHAHDITKDIDMKGPKPADHECQCQSTEEKLAEMQFEINVLKDMVNGLMPIGPEEEFWEVDDDLVSDHHFLDEPRDRTIEMAPYPTTFPDVEDDIQF